MITDVFQHFKSISASLLFWPCKIIFISRGLSLMSFISDVALSSSFPKKRAGTQLVFLLTAVRN